MPEFLYETLLPGGLFSTIDNSHILKLERLNRNLENLTKLGLLEKHNSQLIPEHTFYTLNHSGKLVYEKIKNT